MTSREGRTRIALVTPRFPPDVGGVESYVGWLATALQQSGAFDVEVLTTGRGRTTVRDSFQGVPVTRLGTWLTLSNTPMNPLWLFQVRGWLRRNRVDVVNAHAPVPGLADVAVLSSSVPVVLTYHAGSLVKGGHRLDPLLRAYERHVLPRVFARCADLVAVSPTSLAHSTGRAHLVPPGVDCTLFTPPPSDVAREPRILYVGRIERSSRWKGLQVLVDALAHLRATVPDVRLDVVGDGDDVPELRSLAERRGVADLITWHGRVEHSELPRFYRRALVTVLPSLTESESFGMALLEAMACGCPVVGSDVGGIPFLVRDGVDGLLVPPGDPEALARALRRLVTDPAMAAELGAAGREAAVTRWDWAHQRDRTVRVLDGARGSKARARQSATAAPGRG